MSLLTICQDAVSELNFGGAPQAIVGSNDALARQMLALLKTETKSLSERHDWQALIDDHTITTADGTQTYSLPSDWGRYVTDTFWDATNYWKMRGSIDPMTWQAMKRGIVAAAIRKRYRIKGNLVYIFPTPSAVETLVAEYVSKNLVLDDDGATERETWTADTDTCRLSEHLCKLGLKWRLRHAKGLEYAEAFNEYDRAVRFAIATDTPAEILDDSLPTVEAPPFTANIPQTITGV